MSGQIAGSTLNTAEFWQYFSFGIRVKIILMNPPLRWFACGPHSGFHKILRKKGFCSGTFFEILSAPHGKQRKLDLHEPPFCGKPAGKRQRQRIGEDSFYGF
jgi:hypothetical protein